MNQETLDWLLAQQPVTSSNASNSPATNEITVSDDLFADIPTTAQLQQQQQQAANTPANEITVKDDLFADIPVTPQAIEQKPSLWGQVKKGAAGVAQNYYANKALEAAEEYQRLKLAEGKGLLGASKPSLSGVQNFMGVSAENKEEELQKRKAEIAEYRKKAQEYQTYAENVPVPEAVRNFLDKRRDAHTTWWEDFKEAPFEISANVAAESLAASGVTILAGVGGALVGGLPGAMGAQGMVSGRMEYVNRINEGLQQAGIDINDVDQFIAAVNNDEIMDPIREDALKYSIAIGTMDAASAFLGGKVLAPKSLFARSAAKGQAVNVPVQAVTQAGFGGGGEALGQLWTEGKITDQRAIAAEVAGDFVFAPVEATATLYAVTKGSKGIKEDQLKATNELIDVLNRKRQKAYNSRDPQAIEKANKDFNEFLNIRQNLEKQLDMTDTESLLQAEAVLQTALNTKVFQYHKAKRDFADKSIIESLEKDVRELTNRHQVVFDTIHSQGRTIQAPELMKQQEALDLVKADREFRKEQLQAEEEELFRRKTNPLAAAEEEAKRIAEGGGDSLDQQIGASYAYGKARSESEMADEMAEMESALNYAEVEPLLREQLEAIKTYQTSTGLKKIVAEKKIKKLRAQIAAIKAQRPKSVPLEEQPPGTTPNVEQSTEELAPTEPEPYQPKSLYQIVREGKERRAREGDWEAAEAQAQAQQAEQTQQEIAAWEASQGITEQEAIQQRRQENLHNELRKAWQQVHQQSVNEAHGIIDEAMELGLIDDEASTRQLADNGEIPPDLTQRIANEKRLLAREKAENDREAFVEKQQHRQKVARLEQHIADQQKARDYELALQQRDENLADITEGEIEDWEDLLGITQETAIDEAAQARQARQPAPEPVAEPTAEALLAERVRYAHQVVNAAITNGSIGLLGEPIARKYADRGEIPPSLMSEADQLADQISRLEQHIQSDQARAGWTAEQPAPGAMQEKGTTEYQPIAAPKPESPATPENVFTEPRNISTLDLEKTFQDRFLKFIDEYKNNVQTTPANERTPEQNLIADITSAEVMTPDVAEPLLRRAKALEREDVVDFILIRLQRSTNNTQTTVGVSENNPRYNEIKEKLENRKKELEEKTAKILKEYSKNNMENGTPTTEQPKQTEQTPKNTAPVTNMREFWQRVKSDFIPNYWLNDFGKPTDKIKDFSADQDYYISFDGVTGKEVGKVEKTQGNIINIVYPNGKKMGVMEYENPKIVTVEQFEQFGRKQKLQDIQMQREKERQEERIAAQEKKRQDEIAQEAKNAELIEQYTRHQGINLNRTGISKMTAYDEHGGMSELKIGNDLIYMEPKGHTDSLWTTIIKIQANDPNRPKTVFSREYATFGEAKENMLNDYKEAIIEEMERAPQNYKIDGDAQFEAQLKQIGKEWIKDQQHRFYFSDIIQELAGTNQPIPANAKLWYDKRTGWYDSQNLDDAVYDAAVERLELLRQSIIEEHGKQALEPETPASPETTNTIKQDVEALIKQFPEWWMNEAHTYAIAQGLIDLGLVENEDVLRILWDDSHEVAQFIEPILDGYESNTEEANSIKTLNNDQEESTQSLEDLKALHQDLIEQRNQAEYKDIQAGRTPTGNARLDDRIRQIEDVIKQMEQEQTAQEPTNTTEETETFDPKEFSNVEGNLADLTVENLKAIGESQRYGLKSIAQRLGRSVTDPEQLYDIIQDHIALLDKIPFHIKKKLRAQLEKDQWENTIPFRELSDEVLADLRKVLPVKYFDINQKRLDLSYIAREIQLEAEGKIHKEDRTPRGFTQESGSHTFNKEDGSTETFEYNRIANLDKVSGSPDVVAPFFVELKEGDLLVDKSKRKMGVVSHTKGGKIHFKGEREPWPINVEVHKDDRRKLGDEIRRLKAEQKGKPAPTTPTSTTEETSQGQLQENDFKQDPYDIYKYKTPDPDIELSENRKDGTYSVLVKGRVAGTGIRNRVLAYQRGMEDKEKRGKAEEQRKNDTRNQPLSAAKFNTPLEFGKYKGKTINEIGTEDRGYLRWLADTKLKLNALISDHAGEWLDTNGLWSTEELNEAATLARENILTNENILSGKETSAEVTRKMGKKDQVITITPYPNHLQINTTTYTTKYGNRSRQTGEQTRRNEYNYKSLSEVMTEQEIDQLKKLEAGTVAIPPPTSETIPDENTGRTGQGTLEGVSTGTIQGATRGGDTGPRSPDHTGESSRTDSTSDGYNELRGSETDSLLGTDFHPPGGISNTSHDGDRRGGIDSPSADFIITETQDYDREKFSIAKRFQGNIDAIKLLKSLGTRPATPEQKKILAGYVGWGGMKNVFDADGQVAKGWEKRHAELKALLTEDEYNAAMQSTQNAHYTSWPVINAIYKGLEAIGFTGGRLLETSVGVGNFFGMMPTAMRQRSRLIGVELDHITGGIADKLYGNSARIHQPRDFADFDFAEATYDVVTGNPPFGAETITDLKHKDISGMRIHNYFLLKGMKALRPGGVLAVVVSKGFMDSSANQKGREMMFREARLLGAWRLPNEAFGGQANTDVTTDVIFLQKRENPLIESVARDVNRNPFTNTADFTGADGNTMAINEYFVANPEHLLGDMVMTVGNSRYSAEPEPTLNARKGLNWKKTLLKGTNKLEANYKPEENIESSAVIGNPEASTDIEKAEVNGLYITDTGELYRRMPNREGDTQGAPVTSYVNAQGTEITLRPNQINILKAAVRLARIARDLINLQITDITDPELEPLRQQLNREYDQFIKKNKMINRPYNKSLLINADLTIAPLLMALENKLPQRSKER